MTGDYTVVQPILTALPSLLLSLPDPQSFLAQIRSQLQKTSSVALELSLLSSYLTLSRSPNPQLGRELALLALSSEDSYQLYSLSSIPAVAALAASTDPTDQSVFGLLQIFIGGSLSDLSHSKFPPLNADKERLKLKLQLLLLADLCAKNIGQSVSYGKAAEVLGLSQGEEDEVESWVIDGIHRGLISAKISEPAKEFWVQSAKGRRFQGPEWRKLQDRLMGWRNGIGEVLETITGTKGITV